MNFISLKNFLLYSFHLLQPGTVCRTWRCVAQEPFPRGELFCSSCCQPLTFYFTCRELSLPRAWPSQGGLYPMIDDGEGRRVTSAHWRTTQKHCGVARSPWGGITLAESQCNFSTCSILSLPSLFFPYSENYYSLKKTLHAKLLSICFWRTN